MGESGRREMRYRCVLPVRLDVGRAQLAVETEDVSSSGLFLVTDTTLPVRQLVSVQATLPGGVAFTAHAMVVFARPTGPERRAGLGLKFFGLSREVLDHWLRFVRAVSARELAGPASIAPEQRGSDAAVVLRVRPHGLDALLEVYSRDLADGGMFFQTDQPLLVGSELTAEIIHPDTGEVFELGCVVRRVVKTPTPGLGVEFTSFDPSRRQQLHEFVASVAPPIIIEELVEG